MTDEMNRLIHKALSMYLPNNVVTKTIAKDKNAIDFVIYALPALNHIATYVAPSASRLHHKVVIQKFKNKRLERVIALQGTSNGKRWKIASDELAKIPTEYISLKPNTNSDKATENMNTNKVWTPTESNQLLHTFALQAKTVDPMSITYASLITAFGKGTYTRSETAIDARLYLVKAVLADNKGILAEAYMNQVTVLNEYRKTLKDLGVNVWTGEWTVKTPPKKLELKDFMQEFDITQMGTHVSISEVNMNKLIDLLQS